MDNRLTPEEYELPAETSGWETLAKVAVGVALGIIAAVSIVAVWAV